LKPAAWSPAKIQRIDLVNQVANQLRESILNNGFAPASLLPGEITLAGQFGVSRTVVREALRVLSAQGLVEISHGRPARVKHADHHASVETLGALFKRSNVTPLDLVEVRRVLEGEIAALAAERATSEQLKVLKADCQALKQASTKNQSAQADVAFHVHLAEATGNPCFVRTIQTMRALFFESIRETQERCGPNVHDAILESVEARDPARARLAMFEHIQKTKSLLSNGADAVRKQRASGARNGSRAAAFRPVSDEHIPKIDHPVRSNNSSKSDPGDFEGGFRGGAPMRQVSVSPTV
jgi:GntR family transcriptional repressor for pyruvate dehydrogenase complex